MPKNWKIFLPVTFKGCDTVCAFAGGLKKTTWLNWKSFPEVMDAFYELLSIPTEAS